MTALCARCAGTGWYAYDENHSKPCEACCRHSGGVWQLLEYYGDRNGEWCCRDGCGTTWATADAYHASTLGGRADS